MMRLIILILFMPSACFAASADLGSQVAAGKQLFETTCAASTCHGSGGVGATAPKLVDRNFSLDHVRAALLNGRPGTAMPAFKDLFDADMMASVTAYVLSISTGGRWATAIPVAPENKTAKPFPARVAVGKAWGSPAAGYTVFYDATQMTACRTCHSYRDNGGPVGPDFATLSQTPQKIFEILTKPGAANPDYPVLDVRTKGHIYTGVKHVDVDGVLRIIDVTIVPPVVRTFMADNVVEIVPHTAPDVFNHAVLHYSVQQLLDVAAFLGTPQ